MRGFFYNPPTPIDDVVAAINNYIAYSVAVAAPPTYVAGTVSIVLGDDYYATDTRTVQVVWTGVLPDWPLGSTMNVDLSVNGVTQNVSGTIVDYSGTTRNMTFDLPKAVSLALGPGEGTYSVRVILPNGHRTTPIDASPLIITA